MYRLLPKTAPTSTLWNVQAPDGRMLKFDIQAATTPQEAADIVSYYVEAPVEIIEFTFFTLDPVEVN